MLVFMLWVCASAYAHGVGYRQSEFRAVTLEFFYSTGEKMSYREVRVFSPKDEKFAAQTGRTDEQGRFAFIPDVSGKWRVIVRDEEGHQCNASMTITEDFFTNTEQPECLTASRVGFIHEGIAGSEHNLQHSIHNPLEGKTCTLVKAYCQEVY